MLPVVDISPDAHATTSYIQLTRFHLHLKQLLDLSTEATSTTLHFYTGSKVCCRLKIEIQSTAYKLAAQGHHNDIWCATNSTSSPCSSSLSESHINAYSDGSKASDYIHKVKVVIIMICKCQHLLTSKTSPDLQHAETYNLPSYM
jgi:hypothetical protein